MTTENTSRDMSKGSEMVTTRNLGQVQCQNGIRSDQIVNLLWIECGKVLEKRIEHRNTLDCTRMDMGLNGTLEDDDRQLWNLGKNLFADVGGYQLLHITPEFAGVTSELLFTVLTPILILEGKKNRSLVDILLVGKKFTKSQQLVVIVHKAGDEIQGLSCFVYNSQFILEGGGEGVAQATDGVLH
ncbi:hypothetical protein V8E55_003068 [Tylopilus felleus]